MPSSTRRRATGAFVAALLLSGCTTVGPNFARPTAPTATGYAMAGDPAPASLTLVPETRAAGPWWTAFGSPELDRVIREGLSASPNVAEAAANLERARDQLAAERGQAAPEVRGDAAIQRERINVNSFGIDFFPSPTISLFSIGATVSYDLDLFGGRKRAIEAAEAQAEGDARRADAAYLALTGNIALQAMRIATLNAQLEALQAVVDDDHRTLDMIRKAQKAGGRAPAAVTGGRAQLAEDEAALAPVQRQMALARHQLALLVGKSPAEWTAPDFTFATLTAPTAIPVALPSALVRNRPDILAAEADLHAATARIGVASAAQYPDISLDAGLTQGALKPQKIFSNDSSGWNFGPMVSVPLLNGGQLKARKQASEAEARASLARYQGVVLRAFVQVSDVLAALANDEQALDVLKRSGAAADATLKNAQSAYRLGGGSLLEVVDAQRQASRARRALAEAQGQRYADLVQLYTATAAEWRPAAT